MGWMHDTLYYMSKDPIYRKYHQDRLTFSLLYAFQENFILPLSLTMRLFMAKVHFWLKCQVMFGRSLLI